MKENYSDKGKIELSFDEIMRVFMVLEKMLQPLHRSEWCEDINVRAFGLALITTEMGLSDEIANVRSMLSSKLDEQQEHCLTDMMEEWDEPKLPFGKSYEELKEMLTPYMVSSVSYTETDK